MIHPSPGASSLRDVVCTLNWCSARRLQGRNQAAVIADRCLGLHNAFEHNSTHLRQVPVDNADQSQTRLVLAGESASK